VPLRRRAVGLLVTLKISPAENTAIVNALRYWIEHWDWECPTLFGLERIDVQAVLERWPGVVDATPSHSSLAVNGALRKLLYGASAVDSERVRAICGIPASEVIVLAHKTSRWADSDEAER
jgi:hypothetical protein